MPKYTKEQLEAAVLNAKSIRQVLFEMGLNESGGNYTTVTKWISKWKIDTSHFLGKGSNLGKDPHNKISLNDVLQNKKYIKSNSLKKRLLKKGIFAYKCSICSLSTWNNKDLVLELDHIDGNRKITISQT